MQTANDSQQFTRIDKNPLERNNHYSKFYKILWTVFFFNNKNSHQNYDAIIMCGDVNL